MPPKQIEPLLSPVPPKGNRRFHYYLLEEMHSPPIAPPNAIRWRSYPWPSFLRPGTPDLRVKHGFIEYDEKVSWADLKKYNMLPFDYAEALLYDLWQSLGEDKDKLAGFFEQVFKVVGSAPDPGQIQSALELVSRWPPEQIKAAIKAIEE